MKIEFDPLSRVMRFLKFFILGLVVSTWLESVISNFLYANYKISIVDLWAWIKFYTESIIGITRPVNPKMFGIFLVQFTHWQNALTIAIIFVLSIGLGVTADLFFIWYQRTHMQSKN